MGGHLSPGFEGPDWEPGGTGASLGHESRSTLEHTGSLGSQAMGSLVPWVLPGAVGCLGPLKPFFISEVGTELL